MWTLVLLLLTASASAKKFGGGGGRSRSTQHSYPNSNGYSGTGTGGSHSYPSSHGYSGNNNVPKQTVHHHYNNHYYSPPQQVGYGARSYPVYHSAPPVYVYQYRDSGSRFGTLLTGLALFNLGRMSAGHSHYDANREEYRGNPGEICKLGIRKSNGDYEETRVQCRLMTSFIYESSPEHVSDESGERKIVTSTVVNVTTHSEFTNPDNSTTTVTVTNTTVVDALEDKGRSIEVTPEMTCYLIRTTRDGSYMKKEVPCGLLQTYAHNAWRSSSDRIAPIFTMIVFYMFLLQVI